MNRRTLLLVPLIIGSVVLMSSCTKRVFDASVSPIVSVAKTLQNCVKSVFRTGTCTVHSNPEKVDDTEETLEK